MLHIRGIVLAVCIKNHILNTINLNANFIDFNTNRYRISANVRLRNEPCRAVRLVKVVQHPR